jgi:hypothetical protein
MKTMKESRKSERCAFIKLKNIERNERNAARLHKDTPSDL